MYINKNKSLIIPKGVPLSKVFEVRRLEPNEYINVLLEDGRVLSYRNTDYFNPTTSNWVRAMKITILYEENIIEIEEVFSHLYQQNEYAINNEGC